MIYVENIVNYFVYTYMYMQFSPSFFIPLSLSLSLSLSLPLFLYSSLSPPPLIFLPFLTTVSLVHIMSQLWFSSHFCVACSRFTMCTTCVHVCVCVCLCVEEYSFLVYDVHEKWCEYVHTKYMYMYTREWMGIWSI